MPSTNETAAMLLDELAALDPAHRREVATQLRKVSETFAEVPDRIPGPLPGFLGTGKIGPEHSVKYDEGASPPVTSEEQGQVR